jgi:hypothetical protein
MSESLRNQIYNNLNQNTTDELLDIWLKNHRYDWSETAFELIEEILDERGIEIPTQEPAVWTKKTDSKEPWQDIDENSENAPVFYKTKEVIGLISWLEIAAKATLIISPFQVLFLFIKPLLSFFNIVGTSFSVKAGAIILILIFLLLPAITTYLLYRAIAYILKILMEFEHNSRGVK